MKLEPRIRLKRFRDEVTACLNSPKQESEYKYQVSRQLRDYWRDVLRDQVDGQKGDPWTRWISAAIDGFDVEASTVLSLKKSNIDSLALRNTPEKQGALIRAIAAHYRLHMHLFQDKYVYARNLDDFVFADVPYPFDDPIFVVTDDYSGEPNQLVEIESAGWTQMPEDSEDFELAVRVRYHVAHRIHEGRDMQYGLTQAMMRVAPDNFDVTREYCSYIDGLNGSFVGDGKCRWLTTAPLDNYQMLRGTSVAGPICVAQAASDQPASLLFEVFARSSEFDLAITDLASKSRNSADDVERANLIERVFAIFVQKQNGIDGEHVLLADNRVQK